MYVPTMPLREFDDGQHEAPPGLAEQIQRLRACATRAGMCACCGSPGGCCGCASPPSAAATPRSRRCSPPRPGTTSTPESTTRAARTCRRVRAGAGRRWRDGCPGGPDGPSPRPTRAGSRASAGSATSSATAGGACAAGRSATRTRPAPAGAGQRAARRGLLLDRIGDGPELTLLIDSTPALRFLRAWRRGDTGLLPDGYDLRPRRSGPPSLVRLARRVAGRPGLVFAHVRAFRPSAE